MPRENEDEGDTEDEPRTWYDYQVEKNPRASRPEDAGPRDPAQDMDRVDEGTGLPEDFGPEFDAPATKSEGEGTVGRSWQAIVEQAVADDPLGSPDVAKELENLDPVEWDGDELAEAAKSERDLLREIRDRLDALDGGTAATEKALAKALTRADGQAGGAPSDDPAALLDQVLEQLEGADEALPDESEAGLDAESVEGLAEAYVAAGGSIDDPLAEVVQWAREQAEGLEDAGDRQAVLAALDRLEGNAGDAAA